MNQPPPRSRNVGALFAEKNSAWSKLSRLNTGARLQWRANLRPGTAFALHINDFPARKPQFAALFPANPDAVDLGRSRARVSRFARSFMQVDVVEFGLYGRVSARIAAKPSAMEPERRGARESRLAPLFPAKVEAVEPWRSRAGEPQPRSLAGRATSDERERRQRRPSRQQKGPPQRCVLRRAGKAAWCRETSLTTRSPLLP